MKIETMRKIDYAVGIPLSFVLTWLQFLIPSRQMKGSRPQRILFIELSEMGSAILADPSLQRAQIKHGAEIFFVIFKRNKASLDFLKSVPEKNIFTIEDTSLFKIMGDAIRLLFWCQKNRIDVTIDLELFSRATALISFLTRSPIKVGFHNYHGEGLYRGDFLNRKVSYNPHIHIAKNFVALVDAAFVNEAQVPYLKQAILDEDIRIRQVPVSDQAKTTVREKIRALYPKLSADQKIFLVNPNASEFLPQRKWPLEYYTELIKLVLSRHPDYLILMTGAPAERPEIQTIADAVQNERCINFAGEVKFSELTTLYTLSKVLITNDSGPGHFSSVTPIKSYVFFGPETPLLYGSLGNSTPLYAHYSCSPCVSAYNHRKTPCEDNQCLKVMKPENIYGQIKDSF
ncbi:MAG: glycosyltransferase family 9 protein [Bdellovibrionaceae bacterium]|nr:glycosyltransferase family 9 protein [Pseudobdellovibrionaceae bacterium]